jgi:hypothetical protein
MSRFVWCLVLVLCACRAKTAPEFYALESEATILVDRDGDDAYVSPEMKDVLARLQKISPRAIEGPRAAELIARLEAGRARLEAAQLERQRLASAVAERAARTEPVRFPSAPLPAPSIDAGSGVDAGRPDAMPTHGMPINEFAKQFGACFRDGPEVEIQGLKKASTKIVMDTEACRKKFGRGEGETSYVFDEGKFAGTRHIQTTTTVVDAGRAPAAPAPSQEPDFVIRVPGQPLPTP